MNVLLSKSSYVLMFVTIELILSVLISGLAALIRKLSVEIAMCCVFCFFFTLEMWRLDCFN